MATKSPWWHWFVHHWHYDSRVQKRPHCGRHAAVSMDNLYLYQCCWCGKTKTVSPASYER